MGFRSLVLFILAPLLLAPAAFYGQTPQAEPEPRYDTNSIAAINVMVVVAGQREVAKGNPLSGTHLLVRPESAKTDSDTLDVYLAPADYLKDFEVAFVKGDRLQVTGCKVKYGGNSMILAREVRRDTTTLYLRDNRGNPFWKKS